MTYESKIGAPRGMTYAQYEDLMNNWASSGEEEDLGFGISWLWWMPGWNKERGSHEFFVPMMIHDMEAFNDHEKEDKFLAEQTEALCNYHKKRSLWALRRIFITLIALYRRMEK